LSNLKFYFIIAIKQKEINRLLSIPKFNFIFAKKKEEGDLLIIKRIDRLGGRYGDIIVQEQHITKDIKAETLNIGWK